MRRRGAVLCGLALLLASAFAAARGPTPSPEEISRVWAARMDGRHFTARVRMTVKIDALEEERLLLIWRDDVDGNRERLYARFEAPYDLRNLAILYIENHDRPNDYFMYQPGLDRIRRISEAVARQDIYGVDLEYLGFGLAQSEPTRVESVDLVQLEVPMVRIREKALRWNPRFDVRLSWIDPSNLMLMRSEHLRDGKLRMVARTEEVGRVQDIPVPMRIVFERPADKQAVTMVVEALDFEKPIPPDVFSALQLLK